MTGRKIFLTLISSALFFGFLEIQAAENNHTEVKKGLEAPRNWDFGTIVLSNGKSMRGKLLYQPEKALVLIKHQENVHAFTAESITRFSLYDNSLLVQRNFIAINPDNMPSKSKHIFEIVVQGKLTLLRHQKNKSNAIGYFDTTIQQFMGYTSDFTYYFLFNNQVHQLKNFKRQFMDLVGDSIHKINLYIHRQDLKYGNIPHQIKLIDYFNNLQ